MPEILLIDPPYSFTEIVKLKSKKKQGGFYVRYPHLGLGYLASFLKKENFSVEILDASVEMLNVENIIDIIKDKKPFIVGITVTTPLIRTVYSIIKRIKSENIKCEIVLGGAHISIDPEIIEDMDVQYGFIGEAEYGFLKLCKRLVRDQGEFDEIDGLVYNNNGIIKINKKKVPDDLDALPFPARDLIDNDKYFSPVISGRITSMITARGCPFNCAYCSRPAVGKEYRVRSLENIIKEVKEVINKYEVKYINFEDDTFTLNKDRTRQFCEKVIDEKIKVSWGCQTRADLVDAELLKVMKDSGCIKVSFGVETGSERIRYLINKKVKNEDYIKAFKWCHELGMETNAFVMFGHPTETIKEMEESIKFTCKLSPNYAAFYITTILPGSILCDEAIKEGIIKHPLVWRRYMRGEEYLPSYIPSGLNKKDLDEMSKRAFRKFYLRFKYILSRVRIIRNFNDLKRNIKSGWTIIKDYIIR
ncbi:MAG: radical SAM protein [Candidatus Firestonebacteria bacterium]